MRTRSSTASHVTERVVNHTLDGPRVHPQSSVRMMSNAMAARPSCCCSTGLSDQHTLHTAWYYRRYCSIAPAHVPQRGAHRAQRRGAGHRTRAAAGSRKQIACHPAARRRHAGDAAGHEPRWLAVGVPHLRPAVHRDRDATRQVQDMPGRAPVCGRRRERLHLDA
jgi:hypothetical protein